jgi:hypothetical protein
MPGTRPGMTNREVRAQEMPEKKSHPLDGFIDSAAQALNLPIEPEWKPEVRANLAVILKLAALVGEKELPDDAEPAQVFRA